MRKFNLLFSGAIIASLLLSCSDKHANTHADKDSLRVEVFEYQAMERLEEEPTGDEVKVSTASAFFNALLNGSKYIVMEHGESMDLMNALSEVVEDGRLSPYDAESGQRGIFYSGAPGSYGLVLVGVDSLVISGSGYGDARAQFVTIVDTSALFTFVDCSRVEIENLVIGKPSCTDCDAPIEMRNCRDMVVRSCLLYGGEVCLDVDSIAGLYVESCELRNGAGGAAAIRSGENIYWNNCLFHHNKGFLSWEGEVMLFHNCEIRNNNDSLSRNIQSPITLKACDVFHHEGWGMAKDLINLVEGNVLVDEAGERDGYRPDWQFQRGYDKDDNDDNDNDGDGDDNDSSDDGEGDEDGDGENMQEDDWREMKENGL